jgi:hypothetical protein
MKVAVTRNIAANMVASKIMMRFLLMELLKISGRKVRVVDFIKPDLDTTKITTGSDIRSLFLYISLNKISSALYLLRKTCI